MFISIVIYSLVYFYLLNWFQIHTFLASILNKKEKFKICTDKNILDVFNIKGGVRLKQFRIFTSEKLFGLMGGIPGMPLLMLSSGLLNRLNHSELEWVLLHEAGHYVLWHSVKMSLIQLIVGLAGIFLLKLSNFSLLASLPFGILLALFCVQIMRLFEYEADYYAISRVKDPTGVISAQEKFEVSNGKWFLKEGSWLRKLLWWNISPAKRIAMAKERIKQKN